MEYFSILPATAGNIAYQSIDRENQYFYRNSKMQRQPESQQQPSHARFVDVADDDLRQLQHHHKYSTGTVNTTKYAKRIFLDYLQQKKLSIGDFVCGPATEQDHIASEFFARVRKQDGDLMKRMTYETIKYGVSRYLREELNITMAPLTFPCTFRVHGNMAIALKKANKGYVQHHPQVADCDLQCIFDSVDVSSPQQLQWYVFIMIHTHLCKRGGENVEQYTKTTFAVGKDADGQQYVYQAEDEMTKNQRESSLNKSCDGRMYAQPEWKEKCPLACFLLYLSKLSCSNRLWQRCKPQSHCSEPTWYYNQPIGKNGVHQFMKKASVFFKLSATYTNHCLRVTSISILGRMFSENDIKTISGHSRTSSLHSYKHLSDGQKREMAISVSAVFASQTMDPAGPCCSSSLEVHQVNATTRRSGAHALADLDLSPQMLDPALPTLTPQTYDDEPLSMKPALANVGEKGKPTLVFNNCSHFTINYQ